MTTPRTDEKMWPPRMSILKWPDSKGRYQAALKVMPCSGIEQEYVPIDEFNAAMAEKDGEIYDLKQEAANNRLDLEWPIVKKSYELQAKLDIAARTLGEISETWFIQGTSVKLKCTEAIKQIKGEENENN